MKSIEIQRLLPATFQRAVLPGSPMLALVELMEGLHEGDESVLANLDEVFDPLRTPESFVYFLARWVDLDRLFIPDASRPHERQSLPVPSGLGYLRQLIANASYLSHWRGTTNGLCHFLQIATGIQGFQLDEFPKDTNGNVIPFHLRTHAPKAAEPYRVLIERIIESEKPAYVTTEPVIFEE